MFKYSLVKKFILVFIALCFSLTLSAQNDLEDVVYLKNGGLVRGKIIEYFPDNYVKIETIGGNVWVFKADEVLKIEKEEAYRVAKTKKSVNLHSKGYFNHTDLGFVIGGGSYSYYYYYNPVAISIFTINGYRFPNRFSAGIGFGPDYTAKSSLPFFADIRYEFKDKKFTPLAIFQGGYTFFADGSSHADWDQDYTGGYMINAMFGIKNSFSDNSALIISLGYRRQEQFSTYYNPDLAADINRRDEINRFVVRVGFEFH